MGKKCKRKVQWRRLSLNELESKASDDECGDEDKERYCSTPPPDSRYQNSVSRRPFHPNFHSGDQRRYSPHFDQRGPSFERGPSVERSPYPKFFGRPYHHDNRPQFLGQRRRPYKFFGRGGFYVRGSSPYSGDRGPKRRWSEDDGLVFDDVKGGAGEEEVEDEERPSQPVHTVFIGNEEYTKIQTPRQEVIFKKSSLDKKRDSVDLGSLPSTCESVNGCDPSSQGDQASLAGSIEDTVMSSGEDPPHDNIKESGQYEDSGGIFVPEPGKPPLAGVVMQQAYPGGPMISIPVHWTPFLDPGLIPGDTALTPLNPAFTHVIDPKDLPVDPAHILPVQHDSNGCPVTVQVKVNSDGLPVEIEPSAFTVSLSTLEPHQQEVLLRKSSDLLSGTPHQTPEAAQPEETQKEKEYSTAKVDEEAPKEENEESRRGDQEHGEEFSSDSQYATMSEASTAPTTPSGELCDPSETANISKRRHEKLDEINKQMSRSDSLLDSESYEPDESEELSSFLSLNSLETKDEKCAYQVSDTQCAQEVSATSPVPDSVAVATDSALPQSSNSFFQDDKMLNLQLTDTTDENVVSCKKDGPKRSKKKKSRSISIDSTVSSQNSLADIQQNNKQSDGEPLSKYQVKKNARKLRKEKRSSREKNKSKNNSSGKEIQKSEAESEHNSKFHSTESESFEISEQVETRVESSSPELVNKEEDSDLCEPQSKEFTEDVINKDENSEKKEVEEENGDNLNQNETGTEENEVEENSKANEKKENDENKRKFPPPTQKEDESFTCKPGFVMVPILTPYYDPAVLFGYPVIIPEPPERTYGRKKKKKFKKRYHEDIYLDTELYAGEPFVATPNGYVVPVEASQICQLHGYPYLPNLFPHILPDEGFVSVEHSPYLSEYCPEPVYQKLSLQEEIEKASRRVPKLYEEDCKLAEGGMVHEQVDEEEKLSKDHGESCDSGVSESEELVHLTLTKGAKDGGGGTTDGGGGREKKEEESKNKDESTSSNDVKENDKKQVNENVKVKGKKKKKQAKKNKKVIVEILEPDFSSFNTLTPRFEVSKDSNQKILKENKNSRNRKKKNNKVDNKNSEITESVSPKKIDDQTKNKKTKELEIVEKVCSEKGKSSPQLETKTKIGTRKKEFKKQNKAKSKPQKANNRRTKIVKDEQVCTIEAGSKFNTDFPSPVNECLVEDNFIDEVCEREETSSEVEDAIVIKEDESLTGVQFISMQELLSQESGIGVESEESLTYSENYESCTMRDQDQMELDQESILQTDTDLVQAEQDLNSEEKSSLKSQASVEVLTENIMHCNDGTECFSETCELSEEKSLEFEEIYDHTNEESVPMEDSLLVQTLSPLTLVQSETISSDSLLCSSLCPTSPENFETGLCHISAENVEKLLYSTSLENVEAALCSTSSASIESALCSTFAKNVESASFSTSDENVEAAFCSTSSENIETTLCPTSTSNVEKAPSNRKKVNVSSSSVLAEVSCASFKDLSLTEVVRKWIREVTPEKAFALTDETRHILFPSHDETCEESDHEKSDEIDRLHEQSKNVLGNPFVVSPSKISLDVSGERVASRASPSDRASPRTLAPQRLRRHTTSQDTFNDIDRESAMSNLLRSRLYASSSSSLFPLSLTEDLTFSNDPRVYDPSVYLKYYQLSADIQTTSSTSSTRESTLSLSPLESEDVDLFSEDGPLTPTDRHVISIATELLKSEKIRANMAHISPSFCENTLPMPLCGSTAPYLEKRSEHNEISDGEESDTLDPCCSVSSSGIGSSLASTPNLTPAHQFSSSNTDSKSQPKLEPHPLVNLSVGEGSLPCRTMCCSVM